MSTTHSIRLTRTAQEEHNLNDIQGFFYNVVASEAQGEGLDNAVLRILREPLDPLKQTTKDTYDGVVTVADLQNLPIGEPTPESGNRFRVAAFDFVFDSFIEGDQQWEAIKEDVKDLLASLAASDRLSSVESVVIAA